LHAPSAQRSSNPSVAAGFPHPRAGFPAGTWPVSDRAAGGGFPRVGRGFPRFGRGFPVNGGGISAGIAPQHL